MLGLYLWSLGGQTTVVAIRSVDGEYSVSVDGTPVEFNRSPEGVPNDTRQPQRVEDRITKLPLDGPPSGTIRLIPPTPLSTFASPSGIDSVVVLDEDGDELFRDDFDSLDLDVWELDSGYFTIEDGMLIPQDVDAPDGNSITLRHKGWSDYTVKVVYRNSRGGVIGSHVTDSGGVFYQFELIRDFPNFLDVLNQGRVGLYYGDFIHTSPFESSRSIAAMALEPYPYILLALIAGSVLAVLIATVEGPVVRAAGRAWRWQRWNRTVAVAAACGLAAACFGVTVALAHEYYGPVPHYPDEVMYGFQAKMIAAGRFTTEIFGPSDAYFIETIKPSFIDEIGEWATFYPFGHPLALAIGALFGVMWFLPPLIGAGTVLLTFFLGRHFWGSWAGLAAALMMAISPFVWMQSGNLLSHNTGTFYILMSLLFIVKRDRALLYGALAGLFFGLGINTRPLNMVALVFPFGALMLAYLYQTRTRPRPWLLHTVAFVCVTLVLVAAMFAYNWQVTGTFETTYSGGTGGNASELYGFTEGHSVGIGIRNMQALLSTLLMVITGWPIWVGLAFVFMPFLLGTRDRWDYFVLSCALVQILAYAGYRFSGVFEGPRYWYETMPFLALLAGRGIVLSAAALNQASAWVLSRLRRRQVPQPRLAGSLLVGALLACLIGWGTGGWLFGWNQEQDSPNVPYQAEEMDGVFGVDDRLASLADNMDLQNALVLVKPCGFFRSSHCFGSVFLRNNVDFDGDVVWLYYVEDQVEETIEAFPGRDVYVATWSPVTSIVPFMRADSR